MSRPANAGAVREATAAPPRVRASRARVVSDVSQAIAAIAAAVAAVGATAVAAAGAVGALSDPPERPCRHVVQKRGPAQPEAMFNDLARLRALEVVRADLDRLRAVLLQDP
jgi:hypothetical protein